MCGQALHLLVPVRRICLRDHQVVLEVGRVDLVVLGVRGGLEGGWEVTDSALEIWHCTIRHL